MFDFEKAVQDLIEPFIVPLGFRPAAGSPKAVRFESETVFLQFFFAAAPSYMFVVELGQRLAPERPFGLHEVLQLKGVSQDASYLANLTPMAPATLDQALRQTRDWLEKWALPFLKNEAPAFDQIKAFRKARGLDNADPKKMREIRAEAKQAFERGNLLLYIRLLRSLELVLGATEKEALARAEKQALWG